MSTLTKAAKESGADQVICPHCNSKFATQDLIKLFFRGVLMLLRRGERVTVPNFGIFKAQLLKGRTHATPIMAEGKVSFGDTWVLRFKQSRGARDYLNATAEELAEAEARGEAEDEDGTDED